jgi:hypothetical protein
MTYTFLIQKYAIYDIHFSDSEICELNLIADIAGTSGNLPGLSNIHW